MMKDSNQSLSKLDTESNLQNSEQLLQELMDQQEIKNPELAAKQARLIQKLRESSTNETLDA